MKPIYIALLPTYYQNRVGAEVIIKKLQDDNPDLIVTTPHFMFPYDDIQKQTEYAAALLSKSDGSIIVSTELDAPDEELIVMAVSSGKPAIYTTVNEPTDEQGNY